MYYFSVMSIGSLILLENKFIRTFLSAFVRLKSVGNYGRGLRRDRVIVQKMRGQTAYFRKFRFAVNARNHIADSASSLQDVEQKIPSTISEVISSVTSSPQYAQVSIFFSYHFCQGATPVMLMNVVFESYSA
jgi:hypothetical protein